MLTQEENQELVFLLGKLTWPVSLEVFYALAERGILASADLALIRKRDPVPEILLTKRPPSDPFFAELWHIPGGIIIPGETAISTIEKRVLKPDVGISLSGEPKFLMARDILMGPPGPDTSPRGQEAYRLFQYVLQDGDLEVCVDETKRFCRLDQIPEAFVEHQWPSIDRLRAVHGV